MEQLDARMPGAKGLAEVPNEVGRKGRSGGAGEDSGEQRLDDVRPTIDASKVVLLGKEADDEARQVELLAARQARPARLEGRNPKSVRRGGVRVEELARSCEEVARRVGRDLLDELGRRVGVDVGRGEEEGVLSIDGAEDEVEGLVDPVRLAERLPALHAEDVVHASEETRREALVEDGEELGPDDGVADLAPEEEGGLELDGELAAGEGRVGVDLEDDGEEVLLEGLAVPRLERHHLEEDPCLLPRRRVRLLLVRDPLARHLQQKAADVQVRRLFDQLDDPAQEPASVLSEVRDPETEDLEAADEESKLRVR